MKSKRIRGVGEKWKRPTEDDQGKKSGEEEWNRDENDPTGRGSGRSGRRRGGVGYIHSAANSFVASTTP